MVALKDFLLRGKKTSTMRFRLSGGPTGATEQRMKPSMAVAHLRRRVRRHLTTRREDGVTCPTARLAGYASTDAQSRIEEDRS